MKAYVVLYLLTNGQTLYQSKSTLISYLIKHMISGLLGQI